ncbi:MAG: phage protein [Clostridia bacterium]|jgi:phage protein D|nr:phage protein [Clostridia bacterium]
MGISVANYKIKLNGTELSGDLMTSVEEVTIEDEINLPGMFCIKLNMVDYQKGKWRGIDLKVLKPGDKISISLGLDKVEPMISGEITTLDLNLGEHSYLEIRGFDLIHRLRLGTRSKTFINKKDSEIATEIAREHGLSPVVDDTKTVYPYIYQNNQSNYEFLLERAARIDYEIYTDDKTLYFVKSRAPKAPELPQFTYKKDFDQLVLELRTLTKGSKVEVRGWNPVEKKGIEAVAKKGDETTKMGGKESGFELSVKAFGETPIILPSENLVDRSEAQSVAAATYNSLLRDFITGEGRCKGNPLLKAGKTIKLAGIDERFSGTYYLVSTVHSINNNGYTTTFRVKRVGI